MVKGRPGRDLFSFGGVASGYFAEHPDPAERTFHFTGRPIGQRLGSFRPTIVTGPDLLGPDGPKGMGAKTVVVDPFGRLDGFQEKPGGFRTGKGSFPIPAVAKETRLTA